MVSDVTTRSRASSPSVRELLDQAKIVEQESSHAVMLSHPEAVVKIIETAAEAAD